MQKMARNLVESTIARKDQPFDEKWMIETFERFYARTGGVTYTFNKISIGADHNSGQADADRADQRDGRDGFERPAARRRRLHRELQNRRNVLTVNIYAHKAHAVIARNGKSWPYGSLRVAHSVLAKGQLRQKLGREPGHPAVN